MEKTNLEYFRKLQEFVALKKPDNEFVIMYRTYWGDDPSDSVITNYKQQKKNKEVYEETEDSYYDSYYDDEYIDEDDDF